MQSQKTQKESLVELIFGKCSLVWGREFLGRWDGLNLDEVKADWLRELDRVLDHPEKVRHALENLPSKPPTVFQFRDACIAAPSETVPQLPQPKASPEAIAKAMGGLKLHVQHDPKAWARRLKVEEMGGHRLSAAQRGMWRSALSAELRAERSDE